MSATSTMEKGMLEELLLVCSFVGTRRADESEESFVRGEDYVAWLQDLQRALRRDEGDERSVRVTLGAWQVLRSKLLPIAEASAGDLEATRTLVKIFVLLTMPLTPRALDALRAGKKRETSDDKENAERAIRDPAEKLRTAAVEQVKHLADARAAIAGKPKVLRALLAFFQAPLGKRASERTEEETKDVELALTLLRNLLAPLPSAGDRIDATVVASLDALVAALDKELVLEVVAELAGTVRRRENEPLNLILLEILAATFSQHAPADVASAEFEDLVAEDDEDREEADDGPKPTARGPLLDALKRERTARVVETSTRHPRFGALLRVASAPGVDEPDRCVAGSKAIVSRAAVVTGGAVARTTTVSESPFLSRLKRSQRVFTKRRPVFVADRDLDKQRRGRKKKRADDCRDGGAELFRDGDDDDHQNADEEIEDLQVRGQTRPEEVIRAPTTSRLGVGARRESRRVENSCCLVSTDVSLTNACGELFESAKRELRLESARVLPRDKHCFLALAEFFLAWRRARGLELARQLATTSRRLSEKREARRTYELDYLGISPDDDEGPDSDVEEAEERFSEDQFFPKTLLRVLDVFSVKTVLEDVDFCLEHKRLREVERSVSLYKEMLRAFETLRTGDRAEREDRARLVGAKETDESYAALVSDGMLDRVFYAAEPLDPLPKLLRDWRQGKHTKRHATELVEIIHVSLKLLDSSSSSSYSDARRLDASGYVAKVAHTTTIDLYASLLESYAENSPAVNHFVYAFLFRLARAPHDDARPRAPTSKAIRTLEPLLYTVRFFKIFATILSDRRSQLGSLKALARDTLRHFDAHAAKNPMLYVEALFAHGGVHASKWCARLAEGYDEAPRHQDDDVAKRTLDFDVDDDDDDARREDDDDDDENEIDFSEAAKWDEDAKKRDAEAKHERELMRWTPREDAALASALADAHDAGSRDAIDLDDLVEGLDALAPHHATGTAVERRIAQLERTAAKRDGESLADQLRALATTLEAKAARAKKKKILKKKSLEDLEFEEDLTYLDGTKKRKKKQAAAKKAKRHESEESASKKQQKADDFFSEHDDEEDDGEDKSEGQPEEATKKPVSTTKRANSPPLFGDDDDDAEADDSEESWTKPGSKKRAIGSPSFDDNSDDDDVKNDAQKVSNEQSDEDNGADKVDADKETSEQASLPGSDVATSSGPQFYPSRRLHRRPQHAEYDDDDHLAQPEIETEELVQPNSHIATTKRRRLVALDDDDDDEDDMSPRR